MKKKIIMGAAACMIVALSVVGLNANKTNSSDVTLSDLVMTSEANADCSGTAWLAGGHCVFGYNFCIFRMDGTDCDPYAN
jgi:hypothetical protein